MTMKQLSGLLMRSGKHLFDEEPENQTITVSSSVDNNVADSKPLGDQIDAIANDFSN